MLIVVLPSSLAPFFGLFNFDGGFYFFADFYWGTGGRTIYGSTLVRLNLIWPEYSRSWARSGDPCPSDLCQVGISLPTYRGERCSPCGWQGPYFRDMIRSSRHQPPTLGPTTWEHPRLSARVSECSILRGIPNLRSPFLCVRLPFAI